MAEEISLTHSNKEPNPDAHGLEAVQETMDKFLAAASVNAVYSEPIQNGDTLIIPAAEILSGIGFGMGSGSGPTESDGSQTGGGSGGGGGGRILSRPVAIIIADSTHVRIEPVVDVTKIALAAFTAAGFIFGMLMRMSNPKKVLLKGREE